VDSVGFVKPPFYFTPELVAIVRLQSLPLVFISALAMLSKSSVEIFLKTVSKYSRGRSSLPNKLYGLILPSRSIVRTPTRSLSVKIDEMSWVSEELKKNGEKLEPMPKMEPIELTEEMFKQEGSDKVKRLTQEILALNVLEVNQLLHAMQRRLGIPDDVFYNMGYGGGGGGGGVGGSAENGGSTGPAGQGATAAAAKAPPAAEKTVFDVKLGAVDAKAKIKVIKEVRTITGLGLKEVNYTSQCYDLSSICVDRVII
jgi:large subunit ribosomal protein L7/L12